VAERVGLFLTNPVTALILMGAVMFIWHVPGPYELAVRSSGWHWFEHSCFFFVSLIFWWPVVQPWPSRAQWPRWAMIPYLVIADLQNTALSAVLVFSDRLLYPSYGSGPRLFGFPAQEDQAAAGAIMWVVGSLAFLVPATLIAIQCLSKRRVGVAAASTRKITRTGVHETSNGQGWLYSRQFQVLSFVLLFALVCAGFILLSKSGDDDDDNQVFRGSQQSGPFLVALYGPGGEVPAGEVSFAVLVQDRSSHQILLDSEVNVAVQTSKDEPPSAKQTRVSLGRENKLLFAADVDLDSEGGHLLDVTVQRGADRAVTTFPLDVVKPEESRLPWSYALTFAIAALLGTVYFFRHRQGKSASPAVSTS
jgi:hypothetical protein